MLDSKYIYIGVSLTVSLCVMANCYLIECCNLTGVKCLIDLRIERNKDMIFHHILVFALIHYLNQHPEIENINEFISLLLSTEISSVFLNLNNLLKNSVVKKVNKMAFVSTFYYYRIYKYSYLLMDKNVYNALIVYSRNKFEYCEIYFGLYGLYILNLYWGGLILKKCIKPFIKN